MGGGGGDKRVGERDVGWSRRRRGDEVGGGRLRER